MAIRLIRKSWDEITAHLEQADATMTAKADLIQLLESEHKKVSAEIDGLYDLYRSGQTDKNWFGSKCRPLQARLAQIEDELPRVRADLDVLRINRLSQDDIVSRARDLYDQWPEMPLEDKRRIAEVVVERIDIGKDELNICLLYMPPPPSSPTGQNGQRNFRGSVGSSHALHQEFIGA